MSGVLSVLFLVCGLRSSTPPEALNPDHVQELNFRHACLGQTGTVHLAGILEVLELNDPRLAER